MNDATPSVSSVNQLVALVAHCEQLIARWRQSLPIKDTAFGCEQETHAAAELARRTCADQLAQALASLREKHEEETHTGGGE